MQIKPGVKLAKLTPQMVLGVVIAMSTWEEVTGAPAVITSVSDGRHKEGSLHYSGCGVDLRTQNLSAAKRPLLQVAFREIKIRLGEGFDVILEGVGTSNEHIHIEYDPK